MKKRAKIKRTTEWEDQQRYNEGEESLLGHYEELADQLEAWAKNNGASVSGYLETSGEIWQERSHSVSMEVDVMGGSGNSFFDLRVELFGEKTKDKIYIHGDVGDHHIDFSYGGYDPYMHTFEELLGKALQEVISDFQRQINELKKDIDYLKKLIG